MPIRTEALAELDNQCVALRGQATLRQAFSWLVTLSGSLWWHLVVLREDGTWAAARFDHLQAAARDDRALLDQPLRSLDLLTPVRTVEQSAWGTGEARRLARVSPGGLLIVTRQGSFLGILCAPGPRDASGAIREVTLLLADGRDLPQTCSEPRYTDIACPRQVFKDTPRFNVVVRLTLIPIEQSAVPALLNVRPGSTLRIDLRAPAFEVLNAPFQEIDLLPGRDSAPVVFDLRPRETGTHELIIEIFQGCHPLGAVTLSIEVVEQPMAESQARIHSRILNPERDVPPPDRVLHVAWNREGSTLALSLLEEGGSSWQELAPFRIERAPADWTEQLFAELTDLGQQSPLSTPSVERRLKILGQRLWAMLPEGLRRVYARDRAAWCGSSLLIYSDEPYLPWELVWPYGEDWGDPGPWCITLALSRWLRRNEQGRGNQGAPGHLSLTAIACIAPRSANLPAAREEQAFLTDLLRPLGVEDLSPALPNWEAVMSLLSSARYDWFHAATHGQLRPGQPERDLLCLEGSEGLMPQHLTGPEIEGHLRRVRPGFLFNACHSGRMGFELAGLGGWASRLISSGAGLFLGPLFRVDDETALRMVQVLYRHLVAGAPLAEAARRARCAARRPGDPSWMAYSLYGHPNARIRLPNAGESQLHSNRTPSSTQA